MKVDFNNVRVCAVENYNRLTEILNEKIDSNGVIESFDADEKSVSRIYTRNKDEFSSSMTTIFQGGQIDHLGESKGVQNGTRIFSLRGCHLIAMFARTAVAKLFRVWVLDILDKEVNPVPYGLKETAPTYLTPEMCDHVTVRINELCKIEGKHYNTYYRALKDVFHANSYTLIPISKYADVCDWLGCKPICKMPEYVMVEASEIGELRLRRPYYEDDVLVSKSHLSVLNDFALRGLPNNVVAVNEGRYGELMQAEIDLKKVDELADRLKQKNSVIFDGVDIACLRMMRDLLSKMIPQQLN